jgi:hypothetical protein
METKQIIVSKLLSFTLLPDFKQDYIIYYEHYCKIINYINEQKEFICVSYYILNTNISSDSIFEYIIKYHYNLDLKINYFNDRILIDKNNEIKQKILIKY